jgi:transketolase
LASTSELSLTTLEDIAKRIRRHILNMTAAANSGHVGGSLSAVEIFVALYFRIRRHDPNRPDWPDRDRLVLSKGHATPIIYATLAEAGYFSVDELMTFRKLGSRLQGHVTMGTPPGVENTAGSLGQGFSFGIGQALAARLDERDYRVYCVLGDGELNEGSIWEGAMSASHYRLDNLTAVVDRNHIQNDGFGDEALIPPDERNQHWGGWVREDGHTANIMSLEPLADKWQAFGWHVQEANGHDIAALTEALKQAKAVKGQPAVVIAHTTKGKGVSFTENNPAYHGRAPTPEQLEQALREIG